MAKKISQLDPGLPASGGELIEIVQNAGSYSLPISGIGIYLLKNNISNQNELINPDFDFWQYGTAQSTAGYGSADRWRYISSLASFSASRGTFTIGQTDVPDNPVYYITNTVTTASSTNEYVVLSQRIEDVRKFSGETCTLSFWGSADTSLQVGLEISQSFGTGGSSTVTGTGQVVNLSTIWQRYVVTFQVPSISGQTLGTDHFTQLNLWLTAGSTYDTRSGSIGYQSGTFNFSHIKFERGGIATPFVNRHIGEELALCQRFYEIGDFNAAETGATYAANTTRAIIKFKTTKRSAPSMTEETAFRIYSAGWVTPSSVTFTNTEVDTANLTLTYTGLTAGDAYILDGAWSASSEL